MILWCGLAIRTCASHSAPQPPGSVCLVTSSASACVVALEARSGLSVFMMGPERPLDVIRGKDDEWNLE